MTALSVIVPVRDGAAYLRETLPALRKVLPPDAELIVSDDGSTDGSPDAAFALGARVLRHDTPTGPAAARNRGAGAAQGTLLVFLDADVRVRSETLVRLVEAFADPQVAAAFGSYDDEPAAPGWVSRYKNLAHHFVHQRAREEASTFWAGCGAIRRAAFDSVGGFDERYARPSIEDVELGYRLREAGLRIRLVPAARVTHLKRWTLRSWLVSDVRDRAVPWARLVRSGRGLPRDLNFTGKDRAANAAVALGLAALALSPWHAWVGGAILPALLASLVADVPFLAFVARRHSPLFAAAAALFQVLHRIAAVLGFAVGFLGPNLRSAARSGHGLPSARRPA
jgi:GT2 family glycosyltransferase